VYLPRLRTLAVVFAASLAVVEAQEAPKGWAVPSATLRFDVSVQSQPVPDCAGVLVILPDGGILPKPSPAATVVDDAGTVLPSECVWHNPHEGFGLVFVPPSAGDRAHVYIGGGGAQARKEPLSLFCAGLFLYTRVGRADLGAARDIARGNPPGEDARFGQRDQIGDQENPWGPDDDYASYYRGSLNVKEGGSYYVCTISDEGSEFRIDGKNVASWPGLHNRNEGAKGQFGANVPLSEGRHQVEYLHFEKEGPQEAHLAWKAPGSKPDDVPKTIPPSAYARSGRAVPVTAESRDGRPVAAFHAEALNYIWLGENPATLFRVTPLASLQPNAQRELTWSWPGVVGLRTNELYVLRTGPDPLPVKLSVRDARASSVCQVPLIEGSTPRQASLENAQDRQDYRRALYHLCLAVPPEQRPCAKWDDDQWLALMQVVEPFTGVPLLREILGRSGADLMKRPAEERGRLQELFLEAIRVSQPTELLPWLDRLRRDETDRLRALRLELLRAEYVLYEKKDPAKALEQLLGQTAMASAAGDEGRIRLAVRIGDAQRVAGNREEAQKAYQQADRIVRSRPQPAVPGRGRPSGPDWRAEAVRAGVYYDTVRSYVQEGQFEAARQALDRWEVEFPLSKMKGSFPLAEARFYMAIGDWNRALQVARAYRRMVDMTNELPYAMAIEMECLERLGLKKEAQELAEDIRKRLPTHPVAKEADSILKRAAAPAPAKPAAAKETM